MPTRSMRHQAARSRRRRLLGAALGLAAAAAGAFLLGGHWLARYVATGFAAAGARTTQTAAITPAARPAAGTPPADATSPAGVTSPAAGSPPAAAASPPAGTSAPAASSPADTAAVQQVLTLINQARILDELPALTLSKGLSQSAAAHTAAMAAGCGLSHQCPHEPPLGARETAAGVRWRTAAENIGEGGPEPDTAAAIAKMATALTQDMLKEHAPADGHRRNLLSATFRDIGIAVVRGRSGTVWITQDFAG